MASRSLTVIAQVKDAASANLNRIASSFDKTNKSVKTSSVNFTEFNRVMFGATAFIGMFAKGMRSLTDVLDQGGELERLSNQYERVMGPKGDLFKAISGLTNNSIDRMAAMRSGLALSSLGIINDTKQMAEVIARAGTAAKRAGLQSGQGIENVTKFMKDGQVEHLSFLNVLAGTNPALQAQMAILNKAGGVMGNVISTQARLRIGMMALSAATKNMHEDERDLVDVMADLKQSFFFLKAEAGGFLGKVLGPIADRIREFAFNVSDLIARLKNADPTLVKTVRHMFLIASSVTAAVAALGTARLMFKALGALGIGGIPFIVGSLIGLATAFTDVESAAAGLVNVGKSIGAVVLGTTQLISSFLQSPENFAKGIGKMDNALYEFLHKNGLITLTTNIARTGAVIIQFSKDVGTTLVDWINSAGNAIDGLITKFNNLFGMSNGGAWSRGLIEGIGGVRGALVKAAAASVIAYGGFKLAKAAMGLFRGAKAVTNIATMQAGATSKLGRPSGTMNDPIYVKIAEDFIGPIKQFIKPNKTTAAVASSGFFSKITTPIIAFTNKFPILIQSMGIFKKIVAFAAKELNYFASSVLGKAFAVLSAIGMVKGLFQGFSETGSGFLDLLSSLGSMASSVWTFVNTFLQTTPIISSIVTQLSSLLSVLGMLPKLLIDIIADGYKKLAGWAGLGAGWLADKMNALRTTTDIASANALGITVPETSRTPIKELGLGSTGGTIGVTNVPAMPAGEEQKSALLGDVISRLKEHGNINAISNMVQAIQQAREGDNSIDPEEWSEIFTSAMNAAQITKDTSEMKEQTKAQTKPTLTKSKRC